MRIEELIQRKVKTLPPDATCQDAAELMAAANVGSIVVVDGAIPVGIVTDRDLVVRVMATGQKADSLPLREMMTDEVIFLERDQSLDVAIRTLRDQRIRRLVVADRYGNIEGIVSIDDILTRLVANLAELTEVVDP